MAYSSPSFVVHLDQGSLSFPLSPEGVESLHAALQTLVSHLRTATSVPAGQPKQPLPDVEFRHRGDVMLEIFCNPNIWPNVHAARVLLTLKGSGIKLSTEIDLTQLMDDVATLMEQL